MKKNLFILAALCVFFASPVFADICEGVATVRFKDEGGHVVRKGEAISRLHLQDFDKKGNPRTYAQYGGYVWPANKIKVLNCHLEKNSQNGKITADLILNETPENQKEIKYQRAEKFLMDETGLCHAESSNAARAYVYNSNSKLGRITADFIKRRSEDKNFPEPKWPEGTIYGQNN